MGASYRVRERKREREREKEKERERERERETNTVISAFMSSSYAMPRTAVLQRRKNTVLG